VLRSTAPPNDAARPRCYRPRAELVTLPLTLSVAPDVAWTEAHVSAEYQDRVHRRLVKDSDFVGSERLPSTSAPLREPATVLTTLPSRASFRRSFAPRAPEGFPSGAEGLDPTRFRAGQAPLVDFCNQNNPRARAADHPIPGHAREVALSVGPRWAAPLSSRIQRSGMKKRGPSRGFTGQGPAWLSPFRHLSSRLLVTRALPQPDRLGHLLSWTGGVRGWIVQARQAHALVVCRLRVHPASSLAQSSPRPWPARLREGLG
jgi:hypothetical protein